MNKEIWLPIKPKPYSKYYEVSNMGRVRSIDKEINFNTKKGIKKGRILKLAIRGSYLTVILSHKQVHKQFTVHYLVASAFIPNPENKPTVNHKKGNKLDNRVSQLEWATRSEQMQHAIKTGLFIPILPPHPGFGKNHPRSKTVLQYDLEDKLIAEYGSTQEASKNTGFNQMSISLSCRQNRIHKNYKWSYK